MDRQSTASSLTRIKEFGSWSEQYSSSGKRYFYNRETEVSQWEKPMEWREYERAINEGAASHSPKSSSSGVRGSVSNIPRVMQFSTAGTSAEDVKPNKKPRETGTAVATCSSVPQSPAVKRQKIEVKEEDPEEDIIGPIIFSEEKYRPFLNKDIVNASTKTLADELIQSSWMAHNLTMLILNVSCDIRCAQSLVRTAEMRSSLLAQQLVSISDHLRQLESTFNLPNLPSTSNYS